MPGLHQGFSGQMLQQDVGMAGALAGGSYRLQRMSAAEAAASQQQQQQQQMGHGGMLMESLALPGGGYGWQMQQMGDTPGRPAGVAEAGGGPGSVPYGSADVGSYHAEGGAQ